jgi:hypothetical protein
MATQEDAITIHSSTITPLDRSFSSSSSSSSSVDLAGQFVTVDGRFQFIRYRQQREEESQSGRRVISPSSPTGPLPVAALPLPADINVFSPEEEDSSSTSVETCGAGSTCSTSSWFRRLVPMMMMLLLLLLVVMVWSFVDDPPAASLSFCYLHSSLL